MLAALPGLLFCSNVAMPKTRWAGLALTTESLVKGSGPGATPAAGLFMAFIARATGTVSSSTLRVCFPRRRCPGETTDHISERLPLKICEVWSLLPRQESG